MNRKSSTLLELARQQDLLARAAEVESETSSLPERRLQGHGSTLLAEMAGSTRHARNGVAAYRNVRSLAPAQEVRSTQAMEVETTAKRQSRDALKLP